MGTFHLQAAIATKDLTAVREYLGRTDLNAPVLDLGAVVILLPCGSKRGWFDDQRHQQNLLDLEAYGARIVTLESEIEAATRDEATTGEWLSATTDLSWGEVVDPSREAEVALPVNYSTVHLTLSAQKPERGCALAVPAWLDFRQAQWSGALVKE